MSHLNRIIKLGGHLSKNQRMHNRNFSTSTTATPSSPVVRQDLPNGSLLITLNRPKALNSLNLEMVESLNSILKEVYHQRKKNRVLILKGSGKCFCAGGDVRALRESAIQKNLEYPAKFLKFEYMTDYLVWSLNPTVGSQKDTTIVALMNGYTMGGGLGFSVGSHIKVVNETTSCSMPENAIGLFPDVGGSYFLNRGKLNGALGMYLGLTGVRLNAADCLWSGLATHFVPSSKLEELEEALKTADYTRENPLKIVERFSGSYNEEESPLKRHQRVIESCFTAKSIEDVFMNLKEKTLPEEFERWRKDTLSTLEKMSPTSLKYCFSLFTLGKTSTVEEAFEREYRGCLHFHLNHDFPEGVRAVLVDKDGKPKWEPSKLEEVSKDQIQSLFAKVEGIPDLKVKETLQL